MDVEKARALAVRLMAQYGLTAKGWTFGFNDRKRALGVTMYRKKRIELSRYYLPRVPDAETEDTIRHEIAHALCVERYGRDEGGHGPKWKAVARAVGAKDDRCFDGPVEHRYTYVLKYEDRVIRGYFKLSPGIHERLPSMHLRGRPETKGKLKLFRVVYK